MAHHIVAISGGKDSTAMALRLKELYPSTSFEFVITPTGDELPAMFAHWHRIELLLGRPFRRIGDIDLLGLIREQGMIPNFRARFCTRILKIEPFIEYMESLDGEVFWYSGLRADEEERVGVTLDLPGMKMVYPLREWGWTLANVQAYLESWGVKIPKRTDCGACFYQRIDEWDTLRTEYPDRYATYEAVEEEMGHTFRSPGRDTWPASLKGLREELEGGRKPRKWNGKKKGLGCSWCSR